MYFVCNTDTHASTQIFYVPVHTANVWCPALQKGILHRTTMGLGIGVAGFFSSNFIETVLSLETSLQAKTSEQLTNMD